MPDKLIMMRRASHPDRPYRRPRVLAVAGDSAAGKTTLTRGLVETLGHDRCTAVCVDDYHRYDRRERRDKPFTPLHPDCNYVGIMEQHLQLLATGQSVLKPVYDHSTGSLVRPVLVEPAEYVVVEGLLPLHTRLARACADIRVYLDTPEPVRRKWKVARDVRKRGYTEEEVLASLERREPESEAFIRPQRSEADIVVRFGAIEGRDAPPESPLSVSVLLRPTIRHPDLSNVITEEEGPVQLKLMRDSDGRPVDALQIHGEASASATEEVKKLIWEELGRDDPLPDALGDLGDGRRSEPLALTQLILLHHLLRTLS